MSERHILTLHCEPCMKKQICSKIKDLQWLDDITGATIEGRNALYTVSGIVDCPDRKSSLVPKEPTND